MTPTKNRESEMGEMAKGPWVVAEDEGDAVVMAGDLFVATVHAVGFTNPDADGRRANASLIAAAPDLLATLRKARAWVAQYSEIKGHEAASAAMLGVIDTAIAKAEGRS